MSIPSHPQDRPPLSCTGLIESSTVLRERERERVLSWVGWHDLLARHWQLDFFPLEGRFRQRVHHETEIR